MKSETHMSNLKLPTLTFENLDKLLTKRSRVKVAYATEIMRQSDSIALIHHDSIIAEIAADGSLELNNHGYNSVTTSGRLHKVLKDNGYSEAIAIRQGVMALLDSDLKIRHRGFRTVSARTQGTSRTVTSYAG